MLTMYPMDFEEYLGARGKDLLAEKIREHYIKEQALPEELHQEALGEYYNYCIIGGMPAAVRAETTEQTTLSQTEIRQMLLDSYIADMTKYAAPGESVKIFAAYDSLPSQLARDSKKFQYKLIKSGARASQYGDSIDWLIRAAGIVNKLYKVYPGGLCRLRHFRICLLLNCIIAIRGLCRRDKYESGAVHEQRIRTLQGHFRGKLCGVRPEGKRM